MGRRKKFQNKITNQSIQERIEETFQTLIMVYKFIEKDQENVKLSALRSLADSLKMFYPLTRPFSLFDFKCCAVVSNIIHTVCIEDELHVSLNKINKKRKRAKSDWNILAEIFKNDVYNFFEKHGAFLY